VFRRRKFLIGAEASELGWFTPEGTLMNSEDWADEEARSLTVYLDGWDDPDPAADGTPALDDDFLVFVNGWWEPLVFTVPDVRPGQSWGTEIDSYDPSSSVPGTPLSGGDEITVGPRSVVVLRGPRDAGPRDQDVLRDNQGLSDGNVLQDGSLRDDGGLSVPAPRG
jgi:isoamylase